MGKHRSPHGTPDDRRHGDWRDPLTGAEEVHPLRICRSCGAMSFLRRVEIRSRYDELRSAVTLCLDCLRNARPHDDSSHPDFSLADVINHPQVFDEASAQTIAQAADR